MKTKLILCALTLSLALASAAVRYTLTLSSPFWVGATELQPGDYTVTMSGDKAVFKKGKQVIEAPATLAQSETKYSSTSMVSKDSRIEEIDLGGTTTKILFSIAPVNPAK